MQLTDNTMVYKYKENEIIEYVADNNRFILGVLLPISKKKMIQLTVVRQVTPQRFVKKFAR